MLHLATFDLHPLPVFEQPWTLPVEARVLSWLVLPQYKLFRNKATMATDGLDMPGNRSDLIIIVNVILAASTILSIIVRFARPGKQSQVDAQSRMSISIRSHSLH